MTDSEHARAAENALKKTTVSYPEWLKRKAAGKYPDPALTNWGVAFGHLAAIGAVTPPPVSYPSPPVGGQTINNASGVGVNVTVRKDIQDLTVNGCGDTAVLFQGGVGGAAGSTLSRAKLLRVAELNSVSWGKHGVYGKAANLKLSDLEIECSSHAASGVSLRYHGAQLLRTSIKGAGHAITYYETSTTRGSVLVEDVRGSFTGSTAIWIYPETDFTTEVVQAFTFRRVDFTGSFFLTADKFNGMVKIESCTLNGKPVTAAMVKGVSNLVIS